jgi:AmmeMemoRadiSam system protein A
MRLSKRPVQTVTLIVDGRRTMTTTTFPTRPAAPARHGRAPAPVIDEPDRERLLDIARLALAVAVGIARDGDLDAAIDAARDLAVRAGAFVTLFERGELRGCMGLLEELPARRTVAAAATMAALDDPRFAPLRPDELSKVDLEISLLGPMTRLDAPTEFVAGEDGIVIELGGRRGLLLPQVATEHGLDAEGMLRTVCRKAGLSWDAWTDPRATLLVFAVDRFGGPARVTRSEALPG